MPQSVRTNSRAEAIAPCACRIVVEGIVQGVGFRPFVNRLARRWGVGGAVFNFTGGVEIEIEGHPQAVEGFVEELARTAPPMAVIEAVSCTPIAPAGRTDFTIVASRATDEGHIYVSPDIAICDDCRRELLDPRDRRYRYPFINCTNCGPRYTIIKRLPYDRPNTSMACFEMCEQCAAEYHDIDDRRYHAQPVACHECGQQVSLVADGRCCVGEQALQAAQQMLVAGKIVAVKGLGGFHLACDATNEQAVRCLRRRKNREQKPLAVMAPSLEAVESFCLVDEKSRQLLCSPQAPIVLLPKAHPERLARSVAPDSSDYGVMLPYTPLHILLFEGTDLAALVMTSGNLSDEPLCTDNDEAAERLAGIADGFLLHNRDIVVGCDDSVLRTAKHGPIILRRSRGYAPLPVRLKHQFRETLAVGGQSKNTFCFVRGRDAFLSQHIGDLDDARTADYFQRCLVHLLNVWQAHPQAVACDQHPGYLATGFARQYAEEHHLPLVAVQHHHAHIVSCLADNGVTGPAIGVACDGTGYGEDGTSWGCELMVADLSEYERVGHLANVPLPGGEAAIREPWRMAAVYLERAFGPDFASELDIEFCRRLDREKWDLLSSMIERGVNCPSASSAGRLFDAVSALLGLHAVSAYEGQAAMSLEAVAEPVAEGYPYTLASEGRLLVLDPLPIIEGIVDDLRAGRTRGEIAGKFHRGFAAMLCEAVRCVSRQTGLREVALSGGTFQNRIVLETLCGMLEQHGLKPLYHKSVPPNDAGISLGQAVVAAQRLSRG